MSVFVMASLAELVKKTTAPKERLFALLAWLWVRHVFFCLPTMIENEQSGLLHDKASGFVSVVMSSRGIEVFKR